MDVGDVELPKRSNTGLIVGGVVAVLLAGGAALFMSRAKEPDAPLVAEQTPPASSPTAPAEPAPATGSTVKDEGARSDVPQPPEPEPAAVQVQISTTPRDTDVYAHGALIGTTGAAPFAIDRPRPGAPALVLTFKAEGYKDFELPISGLTQPKLAIELEREKRRSGGSGASSSRPTSPRPEPTKPSQTTKPAQTQPEPAKPVEEPKPKPKPRAPSDVLDPWG